MAIAVDVLWAGRDEGVSDELLRRALVDEPEDFFKANPLVVFYAAKWGRGAPSIGCAYDPRFGYSLLWTRRDPNLAVKYRSMMSVANPRTMAAPILHRIEEVRPHGSFVTGEVALRVLQDFDRDPMVLSGAIEWMPYEDVPENARPGI